MSRDFVWHDAGRVVVFRAGGVVAAPRLLAELGVAGFDLVSTPRALAAATGLAAAARAVHEVPPGQVPDLAAALLEELDGAPTLVALGGGRVIDAAKAVAAVTGAPVAAIPTTLSGAELTGIHRLPAGAEDRARGPVRPGAVVADPAAMTGQPEPLLRASAMNSLAHGVDSLYTPLSSPVTELLAARGAAAMAAALDQPRERRDRAGLAYGSLLCAYAIDSAGFGLHHVVCQSLVRTCGTAHAETNAALLPVTAQFLAPRAPQPFSDLAAALGTDLDGLAARIRELGANPPGLAALGADRACLPAAVEAILARPQLRNVPGPPDGREIAALLDRAW
ncbi:MAG: iron-containing alcohol dehydrogenase [Solirubrobacterales bacterium]